MVEYSPAALHVLRTGNILAVDERPHEFVDRVLDAVFAPEHELGTPLAEVTRLREQFAGHMAGKLVTLGTPLLTNAGRVDGRALSSCVAVPVDLRAPLTAVTPVIESYYEQNMGSGFDLDPVEDPMAVLVALDEHAERLAAAELYERYIGNMANLSIDHPRVHEFVTFKASGHPLSHFNLSVNVSQRFMDALAADDAFVLRDGTRLRAWELWDAIVEAAWRCGDPGLLFLERYDADNPTPLTGRYVTTAPCAEVALAPGESCVFGYVNLAALARDQAVDHELLREVVAALTRVLDNALQVSLAGYPTITSRSVMAAKRKIGIGVCGYADLLVRLRVPYGSARAAEILEDILTLITYESKVASARLAADRGSFTAFPASRYASDATFLSAKYGRIRSSTVAPDAWERLDATIRERGELRNASTTALPPSGRSALLLDASTSIEPWFGVVNFDGAVKADLANWIHRLYPGDTAEATLAAISRQGTCQLPDRVAAEVREVVRCAAEVSPLAHLRIVAVASRCVDEAASKTINLPAAARPGVVRDVFLSAWQSGLKAISVYRDGTAGQQPEVLGGARVA